MGYQPQNNQDEWQEQDQGQSGELRWLLWLGMGAALLFLIGGCLVAGYFVVLRFQMRTEVSAPLLLPTSPVMTATPLPEPTIATHFLAPTATLNPTPTASKAVGSVVAQQLPIAITIDGELSEWVGSPVYWSTHQVYAASNWDGTDDLTAIWRLAWDSKNLYIAAEVIDDLHVQTQSGNQVFRGDSLDMQFDTIRTLDYGDGLSVDDFQIVFSPGDFEALAPSAFRFQGNSDGQILDAPGGHSIAVAAKRTAEGYILEASIPWSDLNLTPAPGLVIGLALNANDNDTPGSAIQEVMKSHVASRTLTNPTTWGTLTLK